jgi:uncharacterized Rmd1/YagE family protein
MNRTYEFKSTFIANEIDLNKIAQHFVINKKYKWEEPLILNSKNLQGIILQPQDKFVYVYHFGSIVFINFNSPEMQDVINYLKKIDFNIEKNVEAFKYSEEFTMVQKDTDIPEIGFKIGYSSVEITILNNYYLDIIATILAKSVALERIENGIEQLQDEIEDVIDKLDNGQLGLNDKNLAKMSGKVLRYKHNMISYLMLLDKPIIAWKEEDAEQFFEELTKLFELKNRYENTQIKCENVLDILNNFASVGHATRSTKLEYWVIILIAFELIIFGIEAISKLFV